MTKQEIRNRELKVGDFVKFSAGGETSRECIWLVIDIDYESKKHSYQALATLKLVKGVWTEWQGSYPIQYEVGYERTVWTTKLKKIKVKVEEAV